MNELAFGLAAILSALFCITMAGIKDRDLAAWFLIGATVPVIAAIAICVLPRLDDNGKPIR